MEKKEIILEDCPHCRGTGVMMHEGNWNVEVECLDCGAHTVYVEYNNEEEKQSAEQMVIRLWNIVKGVTSERGE